jgi:iron(III) transport system substrate-binding protein
VIVVIRNFHFLIAVIAVVISLPYSVAGGAESKLGWQQDWEKTVEAAKKEGEVHVYISGWGGVLESGQFQKAFPEIKVVAVTGKGAQIAQRVMSERRAGRFLADVVSDGINPVLTTFHAGKVLDPLKPLLVLPEVTDESKWWRGKHRYADAEAQYVFRYAAIPQTGSVYYHAPSVNPAEFKSVWDFLSPKWKGKIESRDFRDPGPGNGAMRFLYYHPDIGPNFIRRLYSEMQVAIFRDLRQGTDWLASGRYAICFGCGGDVDIAKSQGLPVDEFGPMKEGVALVSQYGTLGYVNKAPHPNAAKVFINWFLSRDGQSALQKALAKSGEGAPDSLRIDISKDDVLPKDRRSDTADYVDLDSRQEWLDRTPILKVFEEALQGNKK